MKIYYFIIALTCIHTFTFSQIRINEVQARNLSTLISEISGNYDDWIELYNESDSSINISNWYLSDSKKTPNKWSFPKQTIIEPNNYVVVFANKLNLGLNSNFSLKLNGEKIYLFDPELNKIDEFKYPELANDISYGVSPINKKILVYFQSPTPGTKNSNHYFVSDIKNTIPRFTHTAGFYEESQIISMSCLDTSATIYYTTDGSDPTINSEKYTSPLSIKQTTVLKARTFSEHSLSSQTVTQTYFINESFTLPVISISTNPGNLFDNKNGFFVKGDNYNKENLEGSNYLNDWERPAWIEFFDEKGISKFKMCAGLKIHGKSTRHYEQKSLSVHARKKYGTERINYKLFPKSESNEYESFILRNSGNDWGQSMIKDAVIQEIIRERMDIDMQEYAASVVFINGKYWGIYNIREKLNDEYIKYKYGYPEKLINIVEADALEKKYVTTHGDGTDFFELMNFVKENSLKVEENYKYIESKIDINEYIDYTIAQLYFMNTDWPATKT